MNSKEQELYNKVQDLEMFLLWQGAVDITFYYVKEDNCYYKIDAYLPPKPENN